MYTDSNNTLSNEICDVTLALVYGSSKESRNAYTVLTGKALRKWQLGRPWRWLMAV
jgi:hypothetical protein